MVSRLILIALFMIVGYAVQSCQGMGGGSVAGNIGGTEPVNTKESIEYQKAILKCYKTGGSRIVKITGELRCY